jgi:hypothetical protein
MLAGAIGSLPLALALLFAPPAWLQTTATAADYPVKLVEPLTFHDELVEVTDAGTLRRRYRVWGDYAAEVAAWKGKSPMCTWRC